MLDPLAFTLVALTLLLTPGPTNTLLLTSGMVAGWRRSLGLAVAEISGYTAAIFLLAVGIGPLVQAFPALALGLKIIAASYLLSVAILLWKRGGVEVELRAPLEFRHAFVTTLFNPKAFIFAFFVIPHLFDGRRSEALPYLLSLGAMILTAGLAWITAGALISIPVSKTRTGGIAQRVGAVAQFSFAAALLSSVFWG